MMNMTWGMKGGGSGQVHKEKKSPTSLGQIIVEIRSLVIYHCAGKRKGGPKLSPKYAVPPNKGALATA